MCQTSECDMFCMGDDCVKLIVDEICFYLWRSDLLLGCVAGPSLDVLRIVQSFLLSQIFTLSESPKRCLR